MQEQADSDILDGLYADAYRNVWLASVELKVLKERGNQLQDRVDGIVETNRSGERLGVRGKEVLEGMRISFTENYQKVAGKVDAKLKKNLFDQIEKDIEGLAGQDLTSPNVATKIDDIRRAVSLVAREYRWLKELMEKVIREGTLYVLITYQAHPSNGHEPQPTSMARRRARIGVRAAGNIGAGPPEPRFPAAGGRKMSLVRNQVVRWHA